MPFILETIGDLTTFTHWDADENQLTHMLLNQYFQKAKN
jgi:hypothetical protein